MNNTQEITHDNIPHPKDTHDDLAIVVFRMFLLLLLFPLSDSSQITLCINRFRPLLDCGSSS